MSMGLKPLITNFTGTFDIVMAAVRNTATIIYVEKLSIRNKETKNARVIIILTLGSRSWTGDSTGI